MKNLQKTTSYFAFTCLFLLSLFSPLVSKSIAQKIDKNKLKANYVPSKKDLTTYIDPTREVAELEAYKEETSAICRAAEPEGMDTYKNCSKDCKTVCSFEKMVSGRNCFKCQQGGDDTCADIGLFDAPHSWCQPGGVCYEDPMMYCTPPTPMVGPRRSKLTCTSCKKRPDMCWQKFDNTTTLTNCNLGCWNGTCEYKGKYTEKEWDGIKDDIIHCYECITPPPPPTCEEMKWGYDWEQDCTNSCSDPDYCEEFKMTMGGPNDCCDEKIKNLANKGEDEGGEDDGGKRGPGTQTRGGNPWGPSPNPPKGSPWAPGGKYDPHRPVTLTREEICKEVSGTLANPNGDAQLTIWEKENQLKKMQNFQKSLEAYKEKAKEVESHLAPHRAKVEALGREFQAAKEAMTTAQKEMKASEGMIYGHDSDKEAAFEKSQKEFKKVQSQYRNAVRGYKSREKSLMGEVNELRHQAQKDLWQADPRAKQSETLDRTDQYFEAWQDYTRLQQRREISNEVFDKAAKDLQKKIDRGGSKAEDYQRKLNNLNRERKEWDERFDRQENRFAKQVNDVQSRNATDGVGPYTREGLFKSLGDARSVLEGQINKIESLRKALKKAIKNNCPPKNAKEILASLEGKTDGLEEMIKNMESRQQYADAGFPLSPQEKAQMAKNLAMQVASGANWDGVKSMWHFYAEEQANEIARTFDPTDPRVRMKKAFWFTVGVVEGVGKAVKGLAELAIGLNKLGLESMAKIASYGGYGDGTFFGTEASDTLQKFLGAADGNLNLDGLEKLAKVVDKSVEDYFTKLSKSKDYDKTLSRAGGQVGGEVVFDYLTGVGIVGKLDELADAGRAMSKVDELADAGKGLDKIDGLTDVSKAADKLGDGTRVRTDLDLPPGMQSKVDDFVPPKQPSPDSPEGIAKAKAVEAGNKVLTRAPDAPTRPRGPPQAAGQLDNTKPLPVDKNKPITPLSDDVLEALETNTGFRKDHAKAMNEFAQETDSFVIVRDGNPDSVKYFDDPNAVAKPMSSKAKTAPVGDDMGLVVDPTHPRQKKFWDDEFAKAQFDGDLDRLAWLEEKHMKVHKTWNDYGKKMIDSGEFKVDAGGRMRIKVDNPDGTTSWKKIHGDYDLHGVYKKNPDGTMASANYGDGVKAGDGQVLQDQLADKISPDKKFILHGGQDNWKPDPKYVPEKFPDPPATIFFPDGRPPRRLNNADEMRRFYEDEMGVEFPYPKKAKTSLKSGTGSAHSPPGELVLMRTDEGQCVGAHRDAPGQDRSFVFLGKCEWLYKICYTTT